MKLLTKSNDFFTHMEAPLLTVKEGSHIHEALEGASVLLELSQNLLLRLSEHFEPDDDSHSGLIYSTLHLVETAKALVDSSIPVTMRLRDQAD